jgi:hypothetical protein
MTYEDLICASGETLVPLVGQYVFVARYLAEYVYNLVSILCGKNAEFSHVKPGVSYV